MATHSARLEVALAERPVVVGAAVLDRVELAVAVVDADRELPVADDLHLARRKLLDRADVDLAHRYGELELLEPRPLLGERGALAPCAARP